MFKRSRANCFVISLVLGLVGVASPTRAHADFDAQINGSYRSWPLSGVAETTLGYGQLIWGDNKDALYGFARVAADFDAITDYQASAVRVEFFPISILGVRAGQMWQQNHQDFSSYDCYNNVCRGYFSEKFVEGQLYLGAGPLKLAGSYRFTNKSVDQIANPKSLTYYIDPESGLQFSTTQSDHSWRVRGLAAIELSPEYRIGYAQTQFYSDRSDEKSNLWIAFGQGEWGPIKLVLGGGAFKSSIQGTQSTLVAYGQWTLWPKLGY